MNNSMNINVLEILAKFLLITIMYKIDHWGMRQYIH